MKRRKFGLLAGSSVAALTAAATLKSAQAQAFNPDPNLLKTTLTPFGSERAGNADGSIPPWTGGLTAPPLGPKPRCTQANATPRRAACATSAKIPI